MSGTLTGRPQVEKLVEVNGRHFDLRAEGETCWSCTTPTGPGVMGPVGSLLGEAGINIEAAQISQDSTATAPTDHAARRPRRSATAEVAQIADTRCAAQVDLPIGARTNPMAGSSSIATSSHRPVWSTASPRRR